MTGKSILYPPLFFVEWGQPWIVWVRAYQQIEKKKFWTGLFRYHFDFSRSVFLQRVPGLLFLALCARTTIRHLIQQQHPRFVAWHVLLFTSPFESLVLVNERWVGTPNSFYFSLLLKGKFGTVGRLRFSTKSCFNNIAILTLHLLSPPSGHMGIRLTAALFLSVPLPLTSLLSRCFI